jgi:tRNA(Ile)-lysidine synthetase-like protein
MDLPKACPFTENGFDGGRYEVKIYSALPMDVSNEWKVLKIDADKLPKDAVFRFRKDGDEIVKFGGGRKTLKKFFNERKCKVSERGCLPLIASCGKEVFVVCGVEIADAVKVDENTSRVLYIVLQKK